MRKIYNLCVIFILILTSVSGCAAKKRPASPLPVAEELPLIEDAVQLEPLLPEPPPEEKVKKKDIFLILKFSGNVIGLGRETVLKNMLGQWFDILTEISREEKKEPVNIVLTANLIKILLENSKKPLAFDDIIEKEPKELTDKEIEKLKSDYTAPGSSVSLAGLQIREALKYLGKELSADPFIVSLNTKSSLDTADKAQLLEFMKNSIKRFDELLKTVLDMPKTSEAVTSLSDSFMDLLDSERIKVQILESMVNYKVWRGNFPEGFVPRGGSLNREAIKELNKTDLKWVLVSSTSSYEYKLTKPQLLTSDPMFFEHCSLDKIEDYLKNIDEKKKTAEVIIADAELYPGLTALDYLNLLDEKKVLKKIRSLSDSETAVELSTGIVNSLAFKLDLQNDRIFKYLDDMRKVVGQYKNSGKARLDVLNQIQNNMLIAESGDIYSNIDLVDYDRLFRRSIIEIYEKINFSPPKDLYIPISEREPVQLDSDMTDLVEIECDGIKSMGEWDAALKKHDVSSGTIKEIYCGIDKNALYFMIDLSVAVSSFSAKTSDDLEVSSVTVSTVPYIPEYIEPDIEYAGVYIGHFDNPQAALYPPDSNEELSDIQDFPINLDVKWRKKIPGKTIIYRATGTKNWEVISGNYNVGYSSGILEFQVPFKYINPSPKKKVYFKFYTDKGLFPQNKVFYITIPDFKLTKAPLSYIDPLGDTRGPGNYRFTESLAEFSSCFDIRKFEINEKADEKIISIEMSEISNIESAPQGFCLAGFDIYVDINHGEGLGNVAMLPGRNAYTTPEYAWEFCITATGWKTAVYNAAYRKIGEPKVSISQMSRSINIFIDSDMIPASLENWAVIPVVTFTDDRGELVEVLPKEPEEGMFIYGRRNESDTNIIDLVLPPGFRQNEVLGANRKSRAVEIPALLKR